METDPSVSTNLQAVEGSTDVAQKPAETSMQPDAEKEPIDISAIFKERNVHLGIHPEDPRIVTFPEALPKAA